jgi:hypothetical protein
MKNLMLSAVAALALLAGTLPGYADLATFGQYDLIYSQFGSQPFGYVLVEDLGSGLAKVTENVSPNFLVNTGNDTNHFPLAFNLAGSGVINPGSIDPNPPFTLATIASLSQPPFGSFTDGIDGNCNNGGSSNGCGVSLLSFTISNFSGFISNTWDSNGNAPGGNVEIFFASDIIDKSCTGACTGDVGAGSPHPVPGPIVGAGLPGLVLAALGMVGLSRRRRRD